MGAKQTSQLIPLCHPVALEHLEVSFDVSHPNGIRVFCEAECTGKTGVEMEAMTGVTIAALTIYDMCKSVERGIVIEDIALMHKSGGKSGVFDRSSKAEE